MFTELKEIVNNIVLKSFQCHMNRCIHTGIIIKVVYNRKRALDSYDLKELNKHFTFIVNPL